MGNPINPAYPIAAIADVEELMDIAEGMEQEAMLRYEQLAQVMERRHEPEMSALFRDLAALEHDHAEGIARWAVREGLPRPTPRNFAWQMPETFGAEAEGAEAHLLTPYRALGIAVRNEERAFSFYSYLAAMAPDKAVRQKAEALAREELNHVAQLRSLRRRAYHATGHPNRDLRAAVTDLASLLRLARGLDRGSADVERAAAAAIEGQSPEAAAVLQRLAEKDGQKAGGMQGAEPESGTAAGARAAGLLAPNMLTPSGALRLALRNAEEVLEIHMTTAERATDEAVMRAAQIHGEAAVERLALIRSLLDDVTE